MIIIKSGVDFILLLNFQLAIFEKSNKKYDWLCTAKSELMNAITELFPIEEAIKIRDAIDTNALTGVKQPLAHMLHMLSVYNHRLIEYYAQLYANDLERHGEEKAVGSVQDASAAVKSEMDEIIRKIHDWPTDEHFKALQNITTRCKQTLSNIRQQVHCTIAELKIHISFIYHYFTGV